MGNYELPLASSRGLISDMYPNPLSYFENVNKLLKLKKSIYQKVYNELSKINQRENDRPIQEFNGPF